MPIEEKIFGKTPFTITNKMKSRVDELVRDINDEEGRARELFDYMQRNITYDRDNVGPNYLYKPAHEIFILERGVCLDQAYLYTTLAREAGLESYIAFIKRDNNFKEVSHACSTVNISGDIYLVDPAYRTYDIIHNDYKIWSDEETINNYFSLRHSYNRKEGGVFKSSECYFNNYEYEMNNREKNNCLKEKNEELSFLDFINFNDIKIAGGIIGLTYLMWKYAH